MEVGEKVKWTSQAGASTKEKSGVIVAIVPIGVQLQAIARRVNPGEHYATRKSKEAFDFSALPRDHVSYIIEVPSKSGRGKPTLYWPRIKQLQKV